MERKASKHLTYNGYFSKVYFHRIIGCKRQPLLVVSYCHGISRKYVRMQANKDATGSFISLFWLPISGN